MPDEEQVSRRVVDQRVRNSLIDVLELSASFQEQLEYQRRVPMVIVANEVINQWADFAGDVRPTQKNQSAVYSAAEIEVMGAFFEVWDIAADANPGTWWDVSDAHIDPHWQALARAAAKALEVFAVRGRFDGDAEDPRADV